MNAARFTFLLMALAATSFASAGTTGTSGSVIRSKATLTSDDDGKKYHVEVAFSERAPDGTSSELPSMGVIQRLGLGAKAEQIVRDGAVHVKLETTSQPGEKTVHCHVSVKRANTPAIESEFTLTLPPP